VVKAKSRSKAPPMPGFTFCCAQCGNFAENDLTCKSFTYLEDQKLCFLYAEESQLSESTSSFAWSGTVE